MISVTSMWYNESNCYNVNEIFLKLKKIIYVLQINIELNIRKINVDQNEANYFGSNDKNKISDNSSKQNKNERALSYSYADLRIRTLMARKLNKT